MSDPRLSVILTTCNGRFELLRDAVRSIRGQGYKDLEVIIIHDGEGGAIVQDIGWPDNIRYEVCQRPGTKRVGACVNEGLDLAQGEYVTYLCDDDLFLPDKLSLMMAEIDKGADWVVDCVRWCRSDGYRMAQERLGCYMYSTPYEKGHGGLVEALSPSGVNWIAHDCSLHKLTKDRWPTDIEHHTPVDWRFWCKLWQRGLRPTLLDSVGAEAFIPGSWREGMTLDKALTARKGGIEMNGGRMPKRKRPRYAINVSGKQQNVLYNGRKYKVVDGGRILMSYVTARDVGGNPKLMDGFEPMRDLMVPALASSPVVGKVVEKPVGMTEIPRVVEEISEVPEIPEVDEIVPPIESGTVLAEPLEVEPPKPATMDQVIADKRKSLGPTKADLEKLGFREIQGIAKSVGIKNRRRKKEELIVEILKVGVPNIDGGFGDHTITSDDIAR